jgi:hypothetical protein
MWEQIMKWFGINKPEAVAALPEAEPEPSDGTLKGYQLRNLRRSTSNSQYIHADLFHVRSNTFVGNVMSTSEEGLVSIARGRIRDYEEEKVLKSKVIDL